MASCDCALARLPSGYINLPLPPSTAVSSITQIFSNILTWALFKILQTADRCLSVCFSAQKRISLFKTYDRKYMSVCLLKSTYMFLFKRNDWQVIMSVCLLKWDHITEHCFSAQNTLGTDACLSVFSRLF